MKHDKRFDHVQMEFGNLELDNAGLLEALAVSIHKDMSSLFPDVYSKKAGKSSEEKKNPEYF